MSISLKKEQKISLTKESNNSLSKVFMGLGWDVAEAEERKGFFGKLFGGSSEPENIDLDASCLMFDDNKNLIDTVWFRKLHSDDRAVNHSGDNLTGDGDGDDEIISVDLTKLNPKVKSLVFVINSFRGQTFDKIKVASCRLVDSPKNKELAIYKLSGGEKVTGQIMAKVYKENNEWMMQALGVPASGTVQSQLVDRIMTIL